MKVYMLAIAATLLVNNLSAVEDVEHIPVNDQAAEVTVTNGMNPRYTTHNSSNKIFQGVSTYGDQIELEDKSWWLVRPDDRWKLRDWYPGDIVVITQADRSFWKFRTDNYIYACYNERTRQVVDVEITVGPSVNNFYRRWIEVMYLGVGDAYLILNDQSRWPLSENERLIWQKWQQGDSIIIGINNTWWNTQSPNILINVADTYVPVQSGCRTY